MPRHLHTQILVFILVQNVRNKLTNNHKHIHKYTQNQWVGCERQERLSGFANLKRKLKVSHTNCFMVSIVGYNIALRVSLCVGFAVEVDFCGKRF